MFSGPFVVKPFACVTAPFQDDLVQFDDVKLDVWRLAAVKAFMAFAVYMSVVAAPRFLQARVL